MGKLLKYEFRKSRMIHIITLIIIGSLELFFLAGIAFKKDTITAVGALLLTLASLFVPTLICIASAVSLHSDMTNKRGYMLFMTPRNSYQILGAKVIENTVCVVLGNAMIVALGFLDVTILFARFDSLETFWNLMSEILKEFAGLQISVSAVIAFFFNAICTMLCTTVTIYFSDVLASSLLHGRKISWLLAVAFFFTFNILMVVAGNLIFKPSLIPDDVLRLVLAGCFRLVCTVGLYLGAAALMNRHLNV